MNFRHWIAAACVPHEKPLVVAGRCLIAGLATTLVLSLLARITPGQGKRIDHNQQQQRTRKPLPDNIHYPEQVRQWQNRMESPAAYPEEKPVVKQDVAPAASPAFALAQLQAPGPEGAAEQFAFKVAAGAFDTDITRSIRPAGLLVHLLYDSAWGPA